MDELDRICLNCSCFFQDEKDMRDSYYYGICINNEDFEPYIEELFKSMDFSCCYELYSKKRYDGEKEACELFEEPEMIEVPEGMDVFTYLRIENIKHENVDEIIKYLYNPDLTIVKNALSTLSKYIYMSNENAYEGLLNYYMGLGPAESLDDVYLRIKIIELFIMFESKEKTIEAYVNELMRTPSNNTTRQLYSLILERLERHSDEMIVFDLLLNLLNNKQYSYKMRKRIMAVAGI